MGSIKYSNLKVEKAKAIHKNWLLRRIANFFRFVEACVIMVLILRLSFQLPTAIKNSSQYFREFSIFVVSPGIVFVIGNAIVVALFALSGHFPAQGSSSSSSEPDFYLEFIQSSSRKMEKQSRKAEYGKDSSRIDQDQNNNFPENQIIKKEKRMDGNHIKYRENQSMKQIIRTEDKNREKQSKKTGEANMSVELKVYRRCQSENSSCTVQNGRSQPMLRRSETGSRRKGDLYPEDCMSNDEFRRTIEAFIARQQKLRMEEESSID